MTVYELSNNLALREAVPEDNRACYQLFVEALDESELPNSSAKYDLEVERYVNELITGENHLVLLLVDLEDRPVGILIGSIIDMPVFTYTFVSEIVWYIRPEGRSGRAPFRMLEALEWWGTAKGCVYCKVGILSSYTRKMTKRLHKIYRKKGYYPLDTSYFKELT